MLDIDGRLSIPDDELSWKFARAGGPGGQNVNKVASKALLIWQFAASAHVPAEVKDRFRKLYARFVTTEGVVIVTSQRTRDQDRNRQDCLEKLQAMLIEAMKKPRVRRPTKPTRGSKLNRLQNKKRRAGVKSNRRAPTNGE